MLDLRKKIVRRSWNELPMPKSIIDRVEKMGRDEKDVRGLTFNYKNKDLTDNM